MTQRRPISAADTIGYATGSFGTGVFATVPAVLLLYFCTETLNISGSTAAALILIPKIWSILWDPYVGRWSDRSTSRWGRRRPFLVAGIIGMAGAFVVLFNVPALGSFGTIVWVGLSYFALATLYSLYAVPYIAIPAEISDSQQSLARLISWRMTIVMIGILAGAAGAPMLVEAGGGGRTGYGFMGWIIAGACLLIMSIPLLMLRGRDRPANTANDASGSKGLLGDMLAVLSNRWFRNLAIGYLLLATAFGAVSAALPYVVTKGLGQSDGEIGTALGIYLLATIIAVQFWSWLARRIGLSRALCAAAIAYGAGVILIGCLVFFKASWPVALGVLAVAGIPFAGLQVLPFIFVGEIVRGAGEDAEGRFTGVWTATEKLGLAFGPALVGIALSVSGGNVAIGTAAFLCVVPPVLCLISLYFVARADNRSFD